MDMNKPPDMISLNMTVVLALYSATFMRFFWMVTPRNYLGMACHVANEAAQCTQLYRKMAYEQSIKDAPKDVPTDVHANDASTGATDTTQALR